LIVGDVPRFFGCLHVLEPIGLLTFFAPEDRATTSIVPGLDRGGIGAETLCSDEALERRRILAPLGNAAFGGLAFAISFSRTVWFHKRFGHARHHCTALRMAHRCAQHRMVVWARPMTVDFVQTRRTVNRWGGKIPRTIEGHYRVALQPHHVCKRLAS